VSYTTDYMDDHGHGTHCAGIVAALDNEIGVIGVAPEADLYGVKVLDYRGSGSLSDVIAGIQWCIDNGIQIISMSLGTSSHYQPLYDACEDAYMAGILIVAAAGNSYLKFWGMEFDTVTYPAKYYSVIAVGATDNKDVKASFSSTGPALELAAPGVNILSTYLGDSYTTMSGTSMACPHVTGTAALVLVSDETAWASMGYTDGDGSWTNIEVRTVLTQTADDLGTAGKDNWYGHGLVDADEAASESSVPMPPSDNELPVITDATGHVSGTTGEPVTVTALITDNVDVVDARIHYTPIDGSETQVPMIEGAGNLWSVDVPIASDKVGTIPYYITARDAAGNEGRDPTIEYSITVSDNDAPIADAVCSDQTVMVGETVYFYGSASSDNIGVTNYSWDFGDFSAIATGVTVSHEYSNVGTYTVTLTVSDAAGNAASDTLTVTVGEASASPTIHVESIEMALVSRWRGWRVYATATVTVVDSDDNPVEGATVYGHWEGATSDYDSGVTDVNGMVTLNSNALRRPSSGTTFTFVVDEIVKDGFDYDPDVNVETQDSIAV
ncbi:MAG: S8 family serine peptidase, partial [archaeon]|nr:S8 family serine peptidase [archaeon]